MTRRCLGGESIPCSGRFLTCIHGMDYCGAKVIIIYRELYVPENYGVWMVVNAKAEFNRK